MLFLAQAENIVFARYEEWFGEAVGVGGGMEGVACAAPALGCEEGVGIHFQEGGRFVEKLN